MRPTSISLRHVPLIKFIGDRSVKPHPESQGIIPNGQGTVKISTFAASQPKHSKPPSKSQQSTSSLNSKPFDFVSVNELPKRFQNTPFEESEIESINSGVGYL
ncbi:37S ribosomal protein YMR-31, mitochondrial [Wickerhamomyces ciferrii]|uniref:37S ribosomal protein YMR-31, mitochondrial n=1 Tax=Wickerhamomyces ciferrii (strain ATCC 14091 / BCRC 22168 / CBS 111 / JCM 3599 / NBRC 0793 / NRRL Y-1031 F-60-10) TaxID=1206466 RepID=K0KKR3_WICCF|nr:37S ribosomal protein YMR-31, mitochondrial [Wickerhamomyces ciferrii]CCH43596.1 37S ribosomal protein YMR-31, mitochondrial [Wickerhamomyces ciferrii]